MDWKHITNMASGHSSVVVRTPYPIVCCVSIENKKHEVNVRMLKTHGVQSFSAGKKNLIILCALKKLLVTNLDSMAYVLPPNLHV